MTPHLQPYPTYNPSGVDWPSDVSTHWEVRRLRNIVNPACVKTGYEISFTRCFYKPQPLRAPHEIWADICALEQETEELLGEIMGGTKDGRKSSGRNPRHADERRRVASGKESWFWSRQQRDQIERALGARHHRRKIQH